MMTAGSRARARVRATASVTVRARATAKASATARARARVAGLAGAGVGRYDAVPAGRPSAFREMRIRMRISGVGQSAGRRRRHV